MHFLKSKMAVKIGGKTLLAIIQPWMKRLGSNFNHMCAERQHTFICILWHNSITIHLWWTLLGTFGLFWSRLGPFWALFGPFFMKKAPLKSLSVFYITLVDGVRKSRFISVRNSWAILGPCGHFGPFWALLGPFCLFGPFWTLLV